MWLYLLTTKDSLMGKVWGKTFSRCEMLWTAPREIATKELERNTRRGSCVLYNRAEHSQGFSICYKECSGMLRNLPECSMGLDLSMVLKPSALFSLLYSLLRFIDYITDWFEIDSWIYKLINVLKGYLPPWEAVFSFFTYLHILFTSRIWQNSHVEALCLCVVNDLATNNHTGLMYSTFVLLLTSNSDLTINQPKSSAAALPG